MLEQEKYQKREEEEATEKMKEAQAGIQVTATAEQNEVYKPPCQATRDGKMLT